jgi:glutaryl-CoA dehydrogenase
MLQKTIRHRASLLLTAQKAFASNTKLEKFDFLDPLKLSSKLTEEELMIEEVAKQFATEKLMPRVTKAYNEESFDLDIMKEYGELGFLGCTIPDYGLPGVSSTAYGLINR